MCVNAAHVVIHSISMATSCISTCSTLTAVLEQRAADDVVHYDRHRTSADGDVAIIGALVDPLLELDLSESP